MSESIHNICNSNVSEKTDVKTGETEKGNTDGKRRNGEIDVLRFLFALTIVGRHLFGSYKLGVFTTPAIGVEFFFIVSGYLMAKSAEKAKDRIVNKEIGSATWQYIIRKAKTFFLYYLCALIFQIVFRYIVINGQSISKLYDGFIKSIPTISLTFMGLTNNISWYVPNTWFLSCLMIGSFIIYPILLSKYDVTTKILCPLTAMFLVGYAYINKKFIWIGDATDIWNGVCLSGIIRTISELSLGIALYPLTSFVHNKYADKRIGGKLLITICKTFCYFIVLEYVIGKYKNDFSIHALMFLSIGIVLSFSETGFGIPDSKLTRFLGKASLPIFLFHGVLRKICVAIFKPANTSNTKAIIIIICCVLISILFMVVIDWARNILKRKVVRKNEKNN